MESIRTKGILTPLLIAADGPVISGHSLYDAAMRCRRAEVSVFGSADELDILAALVHSKRARAKTNEQFGREVDALLEIEGELARRRQIELAASRESPTLR